MKHYVTGRTSGSVSVPYIFESVESSPPILISISTLYLHLHIKITIQGWEKKNGATMLGHFLLLNSYFPFCVVLEFFTENRWTSLIVQVHFFFPLKLHVFCIQCHTIPRHQRMKDQCFQQR